LLIIFDLDDTLIATSKCIIPRVLKQALLRMIKEGLLVNDFLKMWRLLQDINKRSTSSSEALKEFLRHINGEKFLVYGLEELKKLPNDIKIEPTTHKVNEILKNISLSHKMAIVSRGEEKMQLEKINRAGINMSFFCHIYIVKEEKGNAYKEVVEKEGFTSNNVVVVADRPAIDLVPAKLLGYNTIHFKNGRKTGIMGWSCVDLQITRLGDLVSKLSEIERRAYANS